MTARSWVVVYRATGSKPLLGGVRESRSSRWGSPELARSYLDVVLENNRGAGRECEGSIEPSPADPEIFVHCGAYHQAVGGLCSGCLKKLTRADAKAAGDRVAVEV